MYQTNPWSGLYLYTINFNFLFIYILSMFITNTQGWFTSKLFKNVNKLIRE